MQSHIHILLLLLTSLAASVIATPAQAHGMCKQLFLIALIRLPAARSHDPLTSMVAHAVNFAPVDGADVPEIGGVFTRPSSSGDDEAEVTKKEYRG